MKFTKTQNKNDAKLDPTLIARYLHGGNSYYGQVRGDEIFQVNGDIFGNWETTNISQPLKAVKLLAPVEPKRIVAIGVNSEVYRAFRRGDVLETDANNDVYDSDRPVIFYKRPETICGPNENIIIPEGCTGISGSAELGVKKNALKM